MIRQRYLSPESDAQDSGGGGGGGAGWLGMGLAGASLGFGIGSEISNRKEQRRQNQWNKDYTDFSYYRSRADALSDRDYMNNYNSPASQVKRMREAGLNPALMYGQGNVGQTEMPRSAKSEGSSMPASRIDSSSMQRALDSFFTYIQTQAQTDNLRAQAELNAKNSRNLDTVNELNKFDLISRKTLFPNAIASSDLGIEDKKADIALKKQAFSLNLDANERAQLSNSTNVQKTLEEIKAIRQKRLFDLSQQPNIDQRAQAEIKKLELEMYQLDQQTALLKITNKYAETDAQMKLLLQELEAEIKSGGGSIGGIISKVIGRLERTLSPAELAELKKRYPLLFQ